ncbi:MAG: hypothetical protein ACJAVV_001555 [Alphaproteobacteria bacterium]
MKTSLGIKNSTNQTAKLHKLLVNAFPSQQDSITIHSGELALVHVKSVSKEVPYLNFSNSGHGVFDEEGRDIL